MDLAGPIFQFPFLILWLVDDGENFSRIHGLPFGDEQAFDFSGLRRTDFILHFHGFDDEQTLAGLDDITGFYQDAHDFSRHGRNHLLAAFGFGCAAAPSPPLPGINDFGAELFAARMDPQTRTGFFDAHFEGLPGDQNRVNAARYFDCVGFERLAVQAPARPAARLSFAFAHDFEFAGRTSDLDLELHWLRSSCTRRPSSFQREGGAVVALAGRALPFLLRCQRAAASTAASSATALRAGACGTLFA